MSYVLPANIPVAKVNHMAKPEGKRKEKSIQAVQVLERSEYHRTRLDSTTARVENPPMPHLLLRNPGLLERGKMTSLGLLVSFLSVALTMNRRPLCTAETHCEQIY